MVKGKQGEKAFPEEWGWGVRKVVPKANKGSVAAGDGFVSEQQI